MPSLNTPPSCTLCGDSGHTIRYCRDPVVAYLLVKVRSKKWKSVQSNNMFTLFNWLHRLVSCDLRAILIHKYHVTPRTTSKAKISAIIMEYEFPDATGPDAFWRSHLPNNFIIDRPTNVQNQEERQLILRNIESYFPLTAEHQQMDCDELIHILMIAIHLNRNEERSRFQHNITYVKDVQTQARDDLLECSICYEEVGTEKIVRLNCNHEFCGECMSTHIKKALSPTVTCPMCRSDIITVHELTCEAIC